MEGQRKLGWAVKSSSSVGSVVQLAFASHDTPEQAMRAYEAATGISWAEAQSRGAILVQREIVDVKRPSSNGE